LCLDTRIMALRKTIIQVYSGNEPFGFHDFVRGTLRLFNYTIDRNINLKINVSGAEFEQYMIVENYNYDKLNIRPKVYHMPIDQNLLINELDEFMKTPDPIYVLTSNVWLDRSDIYNTSFLAFDTLVRLKDYLYVEANNKVAAKLLYRLSGISDNLLYGYTIIYINRDDFKFKSTRRNIASVANQIRKNIDLNKDIMVFSNSSQLQTILSQYIEMNSAAIERIDDSDVDISVVESFPSSRDIIIDYIILMKSRKIFRFTDTSIQTGHHVPYNTTPDLLTNVYETAFDINTIIGNLEITKIPLYYLTYTIVGCAGPINPTRFAFQNAMVIDASGNPRSQGPISQPGIAIDSSGNYISQLNNPSGLALDLSGNLYIADTGNHRICMLDTLGNFTTYAGSSTGVAGYLDSGSSNALFNSPTAIVIDKYGRVFVADTGNNAIRVIEKQDKYDSLGNIIQVHILVNTLVGQGSILVSSGVGKTISLNSPQGIAIDSFGILYISDTGNHRICQITSGGDLITVAGSTTIGGTLSYLSGFINGNGTNASFNSPTGLVIDRIGNIFVADTGNNAIRRITKAGNVTTLAGSGQPFFKEGKRQQASFKNPIGITLDTQNILYISDTGNNLIRRITTDGDVLTMVGSPDQKTGAIDGYGAINPTRALVQFNKRATFNRPAALVMNSSNQLIIADPGNNTIRKVDTTFSNPTMIKPVSIQSIKVSHAPGIGLTLGPTLSAPPPHPDSIVYGHRKGQR
jgi:sugar lactone lactonase YvrE